MSSYNKYLCDFTIIIESRFDLHFLLLTIYIQGVIKQVNNLLTGDFSALKSKRMGLLNEMEIIVDFSLVYDYLKTNTKIPVLIYTNF